MEKFVRIKEDCIVFMDEHFYEVETDSGVIYYPSVTGILSLYPKGYGFDQWQRDLGANAEIVAERAMAAGSRVHDGIEKILSGEELEWDGKNYQKEEWEGINRFKNFYDRFNPKVVAVETMVYSHQGKYAGTVDLVCDIGGRRWLIDNKFSKDVYKTHYLQIAAYKYAWDEIHPDYPIDEIGILHLRAQTKTEGRKGSIQGVGWKLDSPNDSFERLFGAFSKILDIYYFENPDPKPKNVELPSKIRL